MNDGQKAFIAERMMTLHAMVCRLDDLEPRAFSRALDLKCDIVTALALKRDLQNAIIKRYRVNQRELETLKSLKG